MDFSRAMRAEYVRAEKSLNIFLLLITVLSALNIAALYVSSYVAIFLLAVGVCAQAAAFFFRNKSEEHCRLGQRLRHFSILADGIGFVPSQIVEAELASTIGVFDSSNSHQEYYSSMKPKGPARLVELVAESSFFSSALAEKAARLCFALVVLLAVLFLYVLFFATLREYDAAQLRLVSQIALLAFSFLGAGELMWIALRLRDLRFGASKILTTCDGLLRLTFISVNEAHSIAAQYELVMSFAPVIFSGLYKRNRTQLTNAWSSRGVADARSAVDTR
jgi:hypothetical protein